MKKFNPVIKIIAIAIFTLPILSCENESKEDTMLNENKAITDQTIDDASDIRTISTETLTRSATSNPVDAITGTKVNLSQFPIIIRDSFGDYTYLKGISNRDSNVPSHLVGYQGYFVYRDKAYESTASYDKTSKTLSMTIGYEYDLYYNYLCTWASTNYFAGAFTPIFQRSKEYRSNSHRMKRVTCSIKQGSFPGMND